MLTAALAMDGACGCGGRGAGTHCFGLQPEFSLTWMTENVPTRRRSGGAAARGPAQGRSAGGMSQTRRLAAILAADVAGVRG